MLLNFDLAGAEWHVTAHLCRDPAMLEVSKSGKSPHPITGARMSGLSEEDVKLEAKVVGDTTDPVQVEARRREHFPDIFSKASFLPRTMSVRQAAKKANHGLNYREGYKTFALTNELEEREAKKIVTLYREVAYPGLTKWYDRIDDEVRRTRTLTNCFGQKCYFMGQLNDDTFRAATAFIPQSTVVQVANRGLVKFMDDDSEIFEPARLLAQVHDSLLIDYLSDDFLQMAQFTQTLALDYLSPTLNYGEDFTLGVEMKGGYIWAKLVEKPISRDLAQLAKDLQTISETCERP